MNKDNENKSNHIDEEVDLNESAEAIDLGNDNQLLSEGDSENNSDCSNNESIGGGDSPNTFVQSEELVDESLEDNNEEIEVFEELIDEDYQNDYSNGNNFIEEVEIVETSSENQSTSLEDMPNNVENDSISVEETNSNNETSQNKVKKKQLIIIVAVILIIGATFVMVKKPFVKEESTKTSSTLDSEEEKKMKSILDRLMSYYEPDSDGATVLKEDITIDTDKLEELEKDIDKVKNEGTKKEFLRLFRKLQEDIINQATNTSLIEDLSSSSVVSYNVTFNKA